MQGSDAARAARSFRASHDLQRLEVTGPSVGLLETVEVKGDSHSNFER